MAGESGRTATVMQQEGDRVLLSVPMVGFPPGFQLRAGERVVLVDEEAGPAVRPLVRSHRVPDVPKGDRLDVEGQAHAMQEATVRGEESTEGHVVWVVDSGTAKGPGQVIAVR